MFWEILRSNRPVVLVGNCALSSGDFGRCMMMSDYYIDAPAFGRLLALPIFALLVLVSFCDRVAAAPNDPFALALDAVMPELLIKYGVPGAVVSRIVDGEVAWTKAFGRANVKTGAPMQTDMVFNHGSNGKVLT